ncbi:hypothetical protein N9J24_00960 [Bacteroidia bacterium]|nr:hypothetical protein [Bacteroidia bacterium]
MPNFADSEKAYSETHYVCILSWNNGFVGLRNAYAIGGEFLDAWLVSYSIAFAGAFYSFEIK